MGNILSVGTFDPPNKLDQSLTMEFARELFSSSFKDIERLLPVFENGWIDERNFTNSIEWFKKNHSLKERNDLFIEKATEYGVQSIEECLTNKHFLQSSVKESEIDAIIFVTSSGMSTPSIEARIMNKMPFSPHTKRIPIWGLGCAGGAAGISRAFEYCKAFPKQNVLVCCVELCSLTFQRGDKTKSNLIGTSLFADGVATALVCGEHSELLMKSRLALKPKIIDVQSTLMPDSEEVMGWDVKDTGLHVVFSRDIPSIIEKWLKPNVTDFLEKHHLQLEQITAFIAHPGGRKVLEAYETSLGIKEEKTAISKEVLRKNGNMSSPTVLYVLEKFMKQTFQSGDIGLMASLGPGFCSELVLISWEGLH
ncbi:naringenin-chalcone synthase [Bacillus sp. TS-2]|nr:naringenin-chalcone synthase [Bacillus sp. TS-2]